MAGPWEDYQKAAPVAQAPWLDYEAPAPKPMDAIPGARVEQEPMAWSDVGKGFARNIVPSTWNMLKGTAEAILNPIDTATALGSLAKSEYLLATGKGTPEELAAAQAFNNMYKQRYGSAEGFKQALATDPASVLADISTVFSGGAGIAKIAGAPAKVTSALSTAGAATNPLTLGPLTMNRPVQAIGKGVVGGAVEGLRGAILPEFLGGGKTLLENKAFRAALGDDPALMRQAADLLKQGKTIQEVAVDMNLPSLAAFAEQAKTSFGSKAPMAAVTQREFELQDVAKQQALANQIATAQQGVQGVRAPVEQQLQAAQSGTAAQQRLAAAMDQYRAQQLAGAQTQVNQLAAQAGRAPEQAVNALRVQTPETVGEAIRTSALSAQEAAKAPIQARAQAAIEAARGTQAYSRSLATAAQSILDEPVTALMPSTAPETRALLQRTTPKPIQGGMMGMTQVGSTLPTMSLDELDALRRAINSDLARTEQAKITGAAANAAMTQRNLLTLKDAVDKLITTSPTLAPGAAQEYMGAMRQFGTEYAPAFRSETARKLLGTKFGAPVLKPEDVVKKYFAPGSVTEPTEFLRMAQYDPSLLDTMRTGIESTFRNAVTDANGAINPTKVANFLQSHEAPLRVLEAGGVDTSAVRNVAQQITGAQKFGGQVTETAQQIAKIQKQLPEAAGEIPLGRGGLPEAQQRVSQVEAEMARAEPARKAFAEQQKATVAGAEAKLAELAPLQKQLDSLQAKIGKEGAATLKTPESVSEIASIADAVSKQIETGKAFENLAAKGMGLGVEAIQKPKSMKIPLNIKTEIVLNILNGISGGALRTELSEQIARRVLSNTKTAAAIERALRSRQRGAALSTLGTIGARTAPVITNALMSQQPPNNNALSR